MNSSDSKADRNGRKGTRRTPRNRKIFYLEFLGVLCEPWRPWRSFYSVIIFFVITFSAIPFSTQAEEAKPLAADPALEARVMQVAEELRCLVCQNETIAASQADLAVDLRKQIRVKLKQGESQAQILDFMVQRYGQFVRYRPAFNPTTALLWIGPFALLALAAFVLAKNIRRRRLDAAPDELSEAESQRIAELLGQEAVRS